MTPDIGFFAEKSEAHVKTEGSVVAATSSTGRVDTYVPMKYVNELRDTRGKIASTGSGEFEIVLTPDADGSVIVDGEVSDIVHLPVTALLLGINSLESFPD